MAKEAHQRGKRKRVYSLDPHATLRATFSLNYLNYLLPAMFKLENSFQSLNAAEDEEGEAKYKKMVKHQVDMALALSAGTGFNWSHALKQKLETNMNVKSVHKLPTLASSTLLDPLRKEISFSVFGEKQLHLLSPVSINPRRPFVLSASHKTCKPEPSSQNSAIISKTQKGRKRARKREEDEEVGRRLATLRRIVPGGNDMGAAKLFSEVESYVVCLQLQVNILRTLVATR